jgi:alpha-glucuronidase
VKHLLLLLALGSCTLSTLRAEDGSRLWLRAESRTPARITVSKQAGSPSATLMIAVDELRSAWQGAPVHLHVKKDKELPPEGFRTEVTKRGITLTSPTEQGVLYAAYALLRAQAVGTLPVKTEVSRPAFALRILNHWDNLDGTVERGYAGASLWQWETLDSDTAKTDRYKAYARANASVGINATVLNNVNASPRILSAVYLHRVKRLADLFRPYGVRVFLSVNFASPMLLDGLPTADPMDDAVKHWWQAKAKEIYDLIPDFGGFLVKANSEGQPGAGDYGRTHADGANLLADALAPHGGTVMWRAFVYSPTDDDRAKQAYLEFKPLDGAFRDNVIIQIKNGPVDFQPREPYSPLFGAMPHTRQMAELQITQEYLGFANHLVFLAPAWEEFFRLVPPASLTAVAGVANTGSDTNWCGHHFAQANWYAFGRLAWEPHLRSETIAEEWLRQTFTTPENTTCDATHNEPHKAICKDNQPDIAALTNLMMTSREAAVNYMMPLGLAHLFAFGHHYGPEPWGDVKGARPDWLPRYYHRADSTGIGFNRTSTGSNAVAQYPEPYRSIYEDPKQCPDEYLLWFHHLPWDYRAAPDDELTLWDKLCIHYAIGVRQVRAFQVTWDKQADYIDPERFEAVQRKLRIQMRDAVWWSDACLLYFSRLSRMPIRNDCERPIHNLDQLMQVTLPINNYQCPPDTLLNKFR